MMSLALLKWKRGSTTVSSPSISFIASVSSATRRAAGGGVGL
jgi:hypothetical protein